jgi:putative membrane protein
VATVTADTAGSLSLVGSDAAAVDVADADADDLRATLATRLRESLAARRGWVETESDDLVDGDEDPRSRSDGHDDA